MVIMLLCIQPVVHHLVALAGHGLCDLALVVGKHQVHAAAVDVEVVAQVLASHGGAFAVPAREAVAPGRGPAHDVLGRGFLPQGEVGLVVLLAHTVELAALVDDVVEVAVREHAVVVVVVVLLDVEVDAAVALIGVAVVHDFLHELLLLDDVACGVGLDAGGQHVERLHGGVVAVGIVLGYLHGLELLEPCLFLDLVVALVGIVLKMAHIGDVAHVAHLVAQVLEVAEEHVEGDGRPGVAQVRVAVHRGAAHVHAHVGRVDGLEELLAAGEGVVDKQFVFHCRSLL